MSPLGQSSDSYRKAGALGARLAALHRRGLPLPATWVLDADPCRDFIEAQLPAGHDPATLLRLSRGRERLSRAARARELLAAGEADGALRAAFEGLFRALSPEAPGGLVLRHSATTEDETVASMAQLGGQARALGSPEALARAAFEAWSLLYLPASLSYLAERGARDVAMALVVQPLVEARVSGTLFTRPPDAPDLGAGGSWVVQAHWGLGACSYDAGRPVDTLRITRTGQVLSALAAPKPTRLGAGDCEVREDEVPEGDVRRLCLEPADCEQIAEVGARVEAAFGPGGGWAIDFALAGGGVLVTGARPMLGRGYPAGGAEFTVWSRAFSGETPGGVLSPLTQSLLLPFSERGLRQGLASLGGTVAKGEALVRFVHGRLYANMSALVEAVGSVPGLDAGGLAEWSGLAGRQALGRRLRRPKAGWSVARVPLTAARLLAEQTRLGLEVERFEHAFAEAERGLDELDLAILPDDALAPTLREARALLGRTGALHLGASTGAYASHLALRTVLSRRFPVTGERHAHAVTAGLPGLPSVQPLVALARLAEVARADAAAAERLRSGGAEHPADLPDGPFRRAFARFLDEHGDRATGEAELCEPRWRERPEPLLAVLSAALEGPVRDPAQAVGLVRRRAEADLAKLGERLSIVEAEVCKVLLDRTRKFLFLRERLRAALSKAFALVRRVGLEVDRRLRRFAPSLDEGAAFYCTDEELLEALGTGHPDLEHLVRLRRYERRRLGRSDPPLSFVGTPSTYRPSPPSSGVLRGLPASGGAVEGPVCVLASASLEGARVPPGAIVVAPAFDLGLTPLLLVAGGLVLEGGGLLSSSLLVARELGVPAAVDVEGATLAIRPGERVRLDGDTGTVEVVAGP
ncbi:MAG TPA: PEP/pyruvate-binding domain-containing protein [Polyangiaceae bacterium]|nr:PEP/pyruvate-binding domain-containing protein [Polyangiaceae bacterium]